jgi:ABC-type glycerol-3-phosphate transport system substrate-binding protein
MKKRQSIIALLLVILLLGSLLMGCGSKKSDKTPDGKTIITVATFDGNEILDYPVVKEMEQKFNVKFEIKTIPWDGWTERVNTMVAGGNLPDVLAWYDMSYGTYVNWSGKGIFKALPDLSQYPNIQKMYADMQPVLDKLKINGQLYALPKTINRNPVNNIDNMFYTYRRDWALKMGYNWSADQVVSYDEFVKFLKDVKAKDPGNVGADNLIPLDSGGGYNDIWGIAMLWNPYLISYTKQNGKYVWGAGLPGSVDALKGLQGFYKDGLLAKDFYTYNLGEGKQRFLEGRTAVLNQFPSVYDMQNDIDTLKRVVPGFKDDDYGLLMVKSPDGKININEKMKYWAGVAFNSKISDEKLKIMMEIADWDMSQDGLNYYAYGVPGTDWTMDNGKVKLNWPTDKDGNYVLNKDNGKNYIKDEITFLKWFRLEGDDVWLEGNPVYRQNIKDMYVNSMNKMQPDANVIPTDLNVQFFSAPNMNKYGSFTLETLNELTKLIVSSKDVEGDWNNWVQTMNRKVDSVLNELNNTK